MTIGGLRKWLSDNTSKAYDQVNPYDSGRSWQTRQPVVNQSVGQNFRDIGNTGLGIAKGVPAAFGVNAAIETGRMAAADLTNNRAAQQASTQRFRQDLGQTIPGGLITGVRPFAQSVATTLTTPINNIYANREANRAQRLLAPIYGQNQAEVEAGRIKQDFLRSALARNGISPTDSGGQIARKIGGQAAVATGNVLMNSALPGIGGSLARTVPTFGGLSAMNAIGETAQLDHPTGQKYFDNALLAGASGAALPLAFHGAGQLVNRARGVRIGSGEPTVQPTTNTRLTANEAQTLTDYVSYKRGLYKPSNSETNMLINDARRIGDKLKIDVTSGSPNEIMDRVSEHLDMRPKAGNATRAHEPAPIYSPDPVLNAQLTKAYQSLDDYVNVVKKLTANNNRLAAEQKLAGKKVGNLPSSDPVDLLKVAAHKLSVKDEGGFVRIGSGEGSLIKKYDKLKSQMANANPAQRQAILGKMDKVVGRLQTLRQERDIQGGAKKLFKSEGGGFNAPKNQAESDAIFGNNGRLAKGQPGLSDQPSQISPQPIETQNPVGSSQPIVAENRLTQGAKSGRQNLSPETIQNLSGEHNVRNTALLADQSSKLVDSLSLNDAINQAHERIAVRPGTLSDADVGFIAKAIERADAEGRPADATALHDGLSEHLVAHGQAAQAASMLYQRSPQGILYQALRDLKRAGVDETPELKARLQKLTDDIKSASNPVEKINAVAKMHQEVSKIMPQHISDQITSIWKAGLLSGAKTQSGNFTSNATFAGLKVVSDPLSAGFDKLLSLGTKERQKTATQQGFASGFAEGTKKGVNTLRTGIDPRNYNGGKYEQHAEINFKNPVVQKIFGVGPNMVFRGMNAADQPWYYAALKKTLYDVAKADGLNKGLRGKELQTYMDKMVTNPTPKMANIAVEAAGKATLNFDTIGSKAIQALHRGVDSFQGKNAELGKAIGHGVINVTAPFVRVPTAYLARALDYSPAGYVKALTKTISSVRAGEGIPQRALSEALGEATTGTAVIFIGGALASKGLISGQQPKDQKEAQLWKAQHTTPNSIKVGNKWLSLNYLGPAGILMGAGRDYHDASARGDNATMTAIAGAGKNLTGQSFLTGFSGFANALNDPGRYGKNLVNSEAGSIVPSIVNDVANQFDKYQRNVNSPLDAIQSRVPGLRNNLQIKRDIFGNPLEQRSHVGNPIANHLNTLINPLRPSDIVQGNPVIDEVARLHQVDVNNKDLQVTPTPIDKVVKINGAAVRLNDTQRYDLQNSIGQLTQENWGKLIQTPEYQALTDVEKANALNRLRQATTEAVQRKYVTENNLGEFNKPASKQAQAILSGNLDVASYAKKNAGTAKQTKNVRVTSSTARLGRSSKSRGLPNIDVSVGSSLSNPVVARSQYKAPKLTLSTGGNRGIAIKKRGVKLSAPRRLA